MAEPQRLGEIRRRFDNCSGCQVRRRRVPVRPCRGPATAGATRRVASSSRRCWRARRTARYGSCAPLDAVEQLRARLGHRQLEPELLDLARRRATAAVQRAIRHARRVTSGVTFGLPSRSPPIQEPNRMGAASSGRPRPVACRSARSSEPQVLRQRVPDGLLEHRERRRTSSSGDGRSRRTSSVSHAAVISRRSVLDARLALEAASASGRSMVGERVGDPAVFVLQRPAHDLGGMRGDHELDPQVADCRVQRLGAAAGLALRIRGREQARQRFLDRRRLRAGPRIALVRAGAGARDGAARRRWRDSGSARSPRDRQRRRDRHACAARRPAPRASSDSPPACRARFASARTRSTRSKSRCPSWRRKRLAQQLAEQPHVVAKGLVWVGRRGGAHLSSLMGGLALRRNAIIAARFDHARHS